MAAAVAEHAFFQYERALQREAEPELRVSLPPAPAAQAPPEPGGRADAPGSQPKTEPEALAAAATDAAVAAADGGGSRSMVLGVEYEAGASGSGLCFWDGCVCLSILCMQDCI